MKNAKKSMFITTILMVAVLIVAVSTATFAWYTASTSGTASGATLVAADSDAVNIAVGWTDDATTNSITFYSKTLSPAIPTAAPKADTTYAGFTFMTATLDNNSLFTNVGTYNDIWEAKNAAIGTQEQDGYVAEGNYSKFYVINKNANNDVDLTMTCSIPAAAAGTENNDKLVVAVFIDGTIAGIFTNLSEYYVATNAEDALILANGTAATSLPTSSALKNTAGIPISLGQYIAGGSDHFVEVEVKAWLDGQLLTQSFANKSASFTFSFAPAVAQP